LADSTGLLEAGRKMIEHKYYTALVKDKSDDLVGIVTLGDLKRILREIKNQPDTFLESNPQISELCTREIIYAYESQSVAETLKQMTARDIYLLPVVAPDNHRQVIGVVERNRIKLARELAETEEALNNLLRTYAG
jgi:CBS domain-containing protein